MKTGRIFLVLVILGCALMAACKPVQPPQAVDSVDPIQQPTVTERADEPEAVQTTESVEIHSEAEITHETKQSSQVDLEWLGVRGISRGDAGPFAFPTQSGGFAAHQPIGRAVAFEMRQPGAPFR